MEPGSDTRTPRLGSAETTVAQARDTGLALTLLALLVALFSRHWGLAIVGVLLLLVCMARPGVFRPLAGPWFAFSRLLGGMSSRVVLALLFFLVVTPVGLLRRLTGADPMRLRQWRQGSGSVFRVRAHLYRPEDLEKPY